MTKQEAKSLALEKLQQYADVSPINRIILIISPQELFLKLVFMRNQCPLCQLFLAHKPQDGMSCAGCPLIYPDCNDHSDSGIQENIIKIQAWEPEEET